MNISPQVQITLEEGVKAPAYQTPGSAGLDLCANESFELHPMQRRLVSTGIKMAVPIGFEGQVRPRSGLAVKHGLSMVNTPGTIDSDYRGEIKILLINLGQDIVHIVKGERIAQLVICPVARAVLVEVSELDETGRGEGGFGSTGI